MALNAESERAGTQEDANATDASSAFALITLGFTRLSAPAGGVGPVKRMILSSDLTSARRGLANLLGSSSGSIRNEIESLARKLNVAV